MQREYNKCMHYECIAVCTYYLLIVPKYPQLVADALINKCEIKLKGIVLISYRLGCDFTRYCRDDIGMEMMQACSVSCVVRAF